MHLVRIFFKECLSYVAHLKVFKHWIWKTLYRFSNFKQNVTQWHFYKYFEKYETHFIRQHLKLHFSIPTRRLTSQLKKKKTHTHTHTYHHIILYNYTKNFQTKRSTVLAAQLNCIVRGMADSLLSNKHVTSLTIASHAASSKYPCCDRVTQPGGPGNGQNYFSLSLRGAQSGK